jgi:hypothetical protein
MIRRRGDVHLLPARSPSRDAPGNLERRRSLHARVQLATGTQKQPDGVRATGRGGAVERSDSLSVKTVWAGVVPKQLADEDGLREG